MMWNYTTCSAQSFLTYTGTFTSFTYHISLRVFYLCKLHYRIQDVLNVHTTRPYGSVTIYPSLCYETPYDEIIKCINGSKELHPSFLLIAQTPSNMHWFGICQHICFDDIIRAHYISRREEIQRSSGIVWENASKLHKYLIWWTAQAFISKHFRKWQWLKSVRTIPHKNMIIQWMVFQSKVFQNFHLGLTLLDFLLVRMIYRVIKRHLVAWVLII